MACERGPSWARSGEGLYAERAIGATYGRSRILYRRDLQRPGEMRRVKNKEVVGFGDVHALERYVLELYEAQEGVCAISGVELQHDEEDADRALICSLDRIDSDGHYEPGNLQVVCRFINFWKSDSADAEFRRLIRIVQTSADAR